MVEESTKENSIIYKLGQALEQQQAEIEKLIENNKN